MGHGAEVEERRKGERRAGKGEVMSIIRYQSATLESILANVATLA